MTERVLGDGAAGPLTPYLQTDDPTAPATEATEPAPSQVPDGNTPVNDAGTAGDTADGATDDAAPAKKTTK